MLLLLSVEPVKIQSQIKPFLFVCFSYLRRYDKYYSFAKVSKKQTWIWTKNEQILINTKHIIEHWIDNTRKTGLIKLDKLHELFTDFWFQKYN